MLNELFIKSSAKQAREYSPLALAYIGDAVFEICARSRVLVESGGAPGKMHKETSQYVRASEQAKMYHKLCGYLTDEELAVIKRGRNAKSNSKAKNAEISEYRHATGVEALFGYLYIKGESARILELFEICISEGDN